MSYHFQACRHTPEPTEADVEALEKGFRQTRDTSLHETADIREQDSRWILEATEGAVDQMRSRVRYMSLSYDDKVRELPEAAKARIEKSSNKDAETRREVEARAGGFQGYVLTLGILRVGLERIISESAKDSVRHRRTDFIDARRQILASLWLAMEAARLGKVVGDFEDANEPEED